MKMIEEKILRALIGSKPQYEKLRAEIIKKHGYNYFKSAQARAFKMLNKRKR